MKAAQPEAIKPVRMTLISKSGVLLDIEQPEMEFPPTNNGTGKAVKRDAIDHRR